MRSINLVCVITMALSLVACQTSVGDVGQTSQADTPASISSDGDEQQKDAAAEENAGNEGGASADSGEVVQVATDKPERAACNVVERRLLPTEDPANMVQIPAVDGDDYVVGSEDAMVTLINYFDFESKESAEFEEILTQLQELYPNDLRVVYRYFPLSAHENGMLAAQAVEAGLLQTPDAFFEIKDFLFENQNEWLSQTPEKFVTWLQQKSAGLGLDMMKFSEDLESDALATKISEAQSAAAQIDTEVSPLIIINGAIYRGPRDFTNLNSIIRLQRMEKNQFTECPEMVIDETQTYQAVIKTSNGNIVIDLFPKEAPLAVNSFIYLAQKGWYDREYFHNVVKDVVAQAGDPSGTGFGGPGYYTTVEVNKSLNFDQPGMVAMYQVRPEQNGSQFFITYKEMPEMNGKYTIIGKVVEGLDLVQSLQSFTPANNGEIPNENIIISVTINEK